MKKLVMTFAMVAFLIGGLTLNANAQDRTNAKSKAAVENKKEEKKATPEVKPQANKQAKSVKSEDKKQAKPVNSEDNNKANKQVKPQDNNQSSKQVKPQSKVDQLLKEYETNVNGYINAYEKFLKADKTQDNSIKPETYLKYMKRAQELENEIDLIKDQLKDEQQKKFEMLKEKFAKALTKK